jgi:hypothetical protein
MSSGYIGGTYMTTGYVHFVGGNIAQFLRLILSPIIQFMIALADFVNNPAINGTGQRTIVLD